jgi:ATP-dependent exoDNAse (exonuclease V) beta subunit
MIRLLLSGVPPAEMFAITFTRKAAEEMRGRLFEWLELLATSPDEVALAFLAEVAWNRPPPSLPCRAPGDCSRRYCIPPLAP